MSELDFSQNDFLSSGIHYSTSMSIFLSQNLYICDLRSGQRRDLYITSLCENNEMCPASSKLVKTT